MTIIGNILGIVFLVGLVYGIIKGGSNGPWARN